MTFREFYNAVLATDLVPEGELDLATIQAIKDMAQFKIDQLDASNARQRQKPSKKEREQAIIYQQIMDLMQDNIPRTGAQVAKELGIAQRKIQHLMGFLAKNGKLGRELVYAGKKDKVFQYHILEGQN